MLSLDHNTNLALLNQTDRQLFLLESIKRLFLTKLNSRPLNNSFGNTIHFSLFDPMDYPTIVEIITNIIDLINRFESNRVNIQRILVSTDETNQKIIINILLNIGILEVAV